MLRLNLQISFFIFVVFNKFIAADSDVDAWQLNRIRANMRNETNPCENFWLYACGNWQETPHGKYEDNFEYVERQYTSELLKLLQRVDDTTTQEAPQLINKLKSYFEACSNLNGSQVHLSSYMRAVPKELNWIQTATATTHSDWVAATASLRLFGLNGVFFDESVDVSYNDSLSFASQLKMPEKRVHFNSAQAMLSYLQKLGLNTSRAAPLFALELQLGKLHSQHYVAEATEQAYTLQELIAQIPEIDWQTYYNVLLATNPVTPQLRIEVSHVAYLRAVGHLLNGMEPDLVKIYLVARLAKFLDDILPEFNAEYCVRHMGVMLPLGMSYIYERFLYGTRRADTAALQQIFAQLKLTFLNYLHGNKLELQPAQLNYLRRKLNAMHLKIGNLPTVASVDWYNAHYAGMNVTASNFFHNHWQALRFRTQQQHARLLQAVGHLDLSTYYVNDDIFGLRDAPYFVHQRNMLVLPMTFMQLPFFHAQQHASLQYSLLGWILAHELNHGFELEGVIFDAAGNESPIGFGIREQSRFKAAHDCLQRTPTAAIKERVADVNGFQLAYDAYFDKLDESHSRWPARFSQRQLFYLNFAQFFCGKLPTAVAHDADDQRTNMVTANMPEFQRDFHCNTPEMHVCEMWRTTVSENSIK